MSSNPHHLHQTHAEIVRRLKRAEGHLRSILTMIGEGRDCLELAQQLHAVEKAIANAKRTLIHDHIDHCLERSIGPMTRAARGPMNEFKALARFL